MNNSFSFFEVFTNIVTHSICKVHSDFCSKYGVPPIKVRKFKKQITVHPKTNKNPFLTFPACF